DHEQCETGEECPPKNSPQGFRMASSQRAFIHSYLFWTGVAAAMPHRVRRLMGRREFYTHPHYPHNPLRSGFPPTQSLQDINPPKDTPVTQNRHCPVRESNQIQPEWFWLGPENL